MADLLNEVFPEKLPDHYAMMDLTAIEDPNLSWKAKAIHSYMISRPPGWKFYMKDLLNRAADGKYSAYNGIKELIEVGYVKKTQIRSNGRIDRVKYDVAWTPKYSKRDSGKTINPSDGLRKNRVPETRNKVSKPLSIKHCSSKQDVSKDTSVRPKGRSSKKTIRLRIETEPAKPKTKNGLLFDSKDPKKRKKGNGTDLSKWFDFELNMKADYERPIIDLQTYLYAKKVKPAQAEVKEVLSYWNKVATEMSNNGHSLSRHEISESKVVYMFQLIVTGILHSTEFTVEDIKKAIDNYAWILNNSPWYNTIYTFPRFFGNKNLFENCITDNVKGNKSYVNRGDKAKKLTGELLVDEIRRYHRRKYGNEDDFVEYWNGYYKLLVDRGEIQSVEDFHKFH